MPSSTSSSERRDATRAIAALLIGLSAYCLALDIGARAGFARVSRIQGRVARDLWTARALRPRASTGEPTMLIVGNSLLLHGVERESLTRRLAREYQVVLLPIENTQYEDWYFGLRRLFADGARPAIIGVALTTRQLMSSTTFGERFARLLMRPADLLEVKRASDLDNTTASAYFFANLSEWLGSRGEIRSWLFFKLIPGLEEVTALFPPKKADLPPSAQVAAAAMPHLQALDRLCREHGARLVVIVPPTLSEDGASAAVQAAAAGAGIAFVVPMRPGEISSGDFLDGFHLNPGGAARFTPRLGEALLAALRIRGAAAFTASSPPAP